MSTNEELNVLFSPSKWTKRGPAEQVVPMHIDFVTKISNTVRNTIPCQLNIPYGSLEEEKIDIYGTDLPSNAPIFVFIHGGYWQELNKNISSYSAATLYKNGVKVIVVGYTLCPNCSLDKIIEEIESAFKACLKYAKQCGSKGLYICGHSAGAHLTACLFRQCFNTLSERDQKHLKGVYFISGVFDLIPLVKTKVNDPLQLNETVAKELSPLYQTFQADKDITFLVIIGENDSPAFHQQSKAFYQKLKQSGYTVNFIELQEVDHFTIVENLSDSNNEIVKIFITNINKG